MRDITKEISHELICDLNINIMFRQEDQKDIPAEVVAVNTRTAIKDLV